MFRYIVSDFVKPIINENARNISDFDKMKGYYTQLSIRLISKLFDIPGGVSGL